MPGFVDKARVRLIAGDGGAGAVSFHREKYVAAGGPDGGDGGRGGDIVLVADDNLASLIDFRYKRKYEAEKGGNGEKNTRTGKSAEPLIVKLPRGTVVRDFETGAVIADISGDEPFVAAKGGKGGFGNAHFKSATRQIPRFAKTGRLGERLDAVLELKLIADVGFVGFPNVGKSTLLAAVSAARPKIANYHFTTLSPMLGVVYVDEGASFVAADIPGLIEGAAGGVGLGHDFLRHIDRCRMLVHLVDVSGVEGRDPKEDFNAINAELKAFSENLSRRPMLVAGNKTDIADPAAEAEFRAFAEEQGYSYCPVSAVSKKGIQELISAVWRMIQTLPPVATYAADYVKPLPEIGRNFAVEHTDEGFLVDAPWLEKILRTTDVDDYESLQYFQRAVTDSGIVAELKRLGASENDTVIVGEYQFDYVE